MGPGPHRPSISTCAQEHLPPPLPPSLFLLFLLCSGQWPQVYSRMQPFLTYLNLCATERSTVLHRSQVHVGSCRLSSSSCVCVCKCVFLLCGNVCGAVTFFVRASPRASSNNKVCVHVCVRACVRACVCALPAHLSAGLFRQVSQTCRWSLHTCLSSYMSLSPNLGLGCVCVSIYVCVCVCLCVCPHWLM